MTSTLIKSKDQDQMLSLLKLYFEQDDQFIEVKNQNMASLSMIIFIRKQYIKHIDEIKTDQIGQGLFGKMHNKGAIKIEFKIGEHKFMIINCHLEPHNEVKRRKE